MLEVGRLGVRGRRCLIGESMCALVNAGLVLLRRDLRLPGEKAAKPTPVDRSGDVSRPPRFNPESVYRQWSLYIFFQYLTEHITMRTFLIARECSV